MEKFKGYGKVSKKVLKSLSDDELSEFIWSVVIVANRATGAHAKINAETIIFDTLDIVTDKFPKTIEALEMFDGFAYV